MDLKSALLALAQNDYTLKTKAELYFKTYAEENIEQLNQNLLEIISSDSCSRLVFLSASILSRYSSIKVLTDSYDYLLQQITNPNLKDIFIDELIYSKKY